MSLVSLEETGVTTQTLGEHANSTQKGPALPGHRTCNKKIFFKKALVLIILPPCCLIHVTQTPSAFSWKHKAKSRSAIAAFYLACCC